VSLGYEEKSAKKSPISNAGGVADRRTGHPWLQMRGDWLAAAGFDIKTPVRIRVMKGCLVLTLVGE
jgi:hypothetical protein